MTELKPYDPQNIFAKILRGDILCTRVFEDAVALAFLDIFPQSEGHTLVIPKKARATMLLDIDPGDLKELMTRVQLVARAVERALSPDGFRIVQFNGSASGQTVFHIHFHIIPTYANRPLGRHASGTAADPAALAAIATKISAAL
jgi:histidine triad (HIT) family protein